MKLLTLISLFAFCASGCVSTTNVSIKSPCEQVQAYKTQLEQYRAEMQGAQAMMGGDQTESQRDARNRQLSRVGEQMDRTVTALGQAKQECVALGGNPDG